MCFLQTRCSSCHPKTLKEHQSTDPTSERQWLASSFWHPPPESKWTRRCFLYTTSLWQNAWNTICNSESTGRSSKPRDWQNGEYLVKPCHVIRQCEWGAPALWQNRLFNVTQPCRQTGGGNQEVQKCLGVLLPKRQHTLSSTSDNMHIITV